MVSGCSLQIERTAQQGWPVVHAATALGTLLLRCDGVSMRTTVTIDDDVLEVARALAARDRISLGSALSELARRGFSNEPAGMDARDGSLFAVPPDARPITSEDVYRALRD